MLEIAIVYKSALYTQFWLKLLDFSTSGALRTLQANTLEQFEHSGNACIASEASYARNLESNPVHRVAFR